MLILNLNFFLNWLMLGRWMQEAVLFLFICLWYEGLSPGPCARYTVCPWSSKLHISNPCIFCLISKGVLYVFCWEIVILTYSETEARCQLQLVKCLLSKHENQCLDSQYSGKDMERGGDWWVPECWLASQPSSSVRSGFNEKHWLNKHKNKSPNQLALPS